ncbi:MAG: hypothetical protein OXI39_07770 [Gemmatimonadota bacterium]|uniref:hypothetical protein n=1 Tax=Candidatus Palauibacter scopulicola TaxID=3056741 RepID=UPI002397554B|nr:hypothetical protein [Candidatus Palauibacter scopulicola]MDE2662885.1 hypothetical protein [Candidatus Palauibacter scopulicola]
MRSKDKRRRGPEPALERGNDGANPGPAAVVPRWAPWVLFPALGIVLFASFIFSDAMLVGTDTLSGGYHARALYAEDIRELGRVPLWQPEVLGGTPYIDGLSAGDALYPPSLLLLLLTETYRSLGWKLILHVIAAGFFMFGWTRALGVSRSAALVSGVGYMLAPVMVSLVYGGQDGKLFVTALAPLLFLCTERFFLRPRLSSFTGIALVVAAVILTPHFQLAYFLFAAAGAFAIFRTIRLLRRGSRSLSGVRSRRALGRFGFFLLASVAGAIIAGGQLIPAVDYVSEFSRRTATSGELAGETGEAWSSSWSLHPEEVASLVIPQFVGSSVNGSAAWAAGTYWGRNPFKLNSEYAGLVLLLLAAVSFAGGARRGTRWFFAGLAGAVLLFALGAHTPVWRVAYEVVPGIRMFRAPSTAMFLFAFSVATLAALGVDRLRAARREAPASDKPERVLLWGAAILGGVALLASVGRLTSTWTAVFGIDEGRQAALAAAAPHITEGAWLAFVLAGVLVILAWAYRGSRLRPALFVLGLVALVATDALRVDRIFVQTMDFHQWAAPDPNIQAVLERERGSEEPYRMLSLRRAGQDLDPVLSGIEMAAGHHPNDLARYRELIGMAGSGLPLNLLQSGNIRALLNVRYILWPDLAMGQSPAGPVLSRTQTPDGRTVESVFEEAGLPRARLVGSAVVKTDEEAVPYMLSPDFDPEREVVLADAPSLELDGGSVSGEVTWLERGPDRLRLEVSAERPALLVVADNWYPAWKARVNGESVPVMRAYHTLRAVPVPAGRAQVEMYYESGLLMWSFWLGVAVLLALLAANGVQFRRARSERSSA